MTITITEPKAAGTPASMLPAAISAPKAKAEPEKAKKKMDLNALIMATIKARAPKTKTSGSVEITNTKKAVLSSVDYVITTGIAPFDDLVGAMAFGRITEISGQESCGKTQLVIRTAVRAQTLNVRMAVRVDGVVNLVPVDKPVYMSILYVDNEQSIDDDAKIIVDGTPLEVNLMRCDTVDQMFYMIDTVIEKSAIAQKEDPATLYMVLIIVDTVAATSSQQEMVQEWGKQDYSRHAQQYSQGFRIMARKVSRGNVAMICTNQVRDSFKSQNAGKSKMRTAGLQTEDLATFGGKALKFYATHRVFMQKMREYKTHPKLMFPDGILIGFKSIKNRIKMPYREGRMVLLFGDETGAGGGFSHEYSVLETLIYFKYAVISKDAKNIVFKFNQKGIETTTFGSATATTLDEDDAMTHAARRGKKDPAIAFRADWPDFYRAHKADVDKLYDAAIAQAFSNTVIAVDEDEDADAIELLNEEEGADAD